ncbi:MspA family porin [Rhodococcus sp. 2H158]
MKTSITNGLKAAGIAATAAVALGFATAGTANADTFVPLPGGSITETLADGTEVTIDLTNERANISPSMGSTPLHRNVWVSGDAKVQLNGGNVKNAKNRIQPGYIVACQLTFGGNATAGADLKGSANLISGEGSVTPGISNSGQVALGPGQAVDYRVIDRTVPDAFGAESHVFFNAFNGANGSVSWTDSTMNVEGCAGYAQARSYVKVTVDTGNVVQQVTLWGQPFSIG